MANKISATIKQRRAFENIKMAEFSEKGIPKGTSLLKAGYSQNIADNPDKVLESLGYKQLQRDWDEQVGKIFPVSRVLALADKLTKEYEREGKLMTGKRDCLGVLYFLAKITGRLTTGQLGDDDLLMGSELKITLRTPLKSGSEELPVTQIKRPPEA